MATPTANGAKALTAIASYLDEEGYGPDGEQGYSDYMLEDLAAELGVTMDSAKGYIGDLVKKGLIWTYNADHIADRTAFLYLHEAGWDWWAAQQDTVLYDF